MDAMVVKHSYRLMHKLRKLGNKRIFPTCPNIPNENGIACISQYFLNYYRIQMVSHLSTDQQSDKEEAELLKAQEERKILASKPTHSYSDEDLLVMRNVSRLNPSSYNKLKHVNLTQRLLPDMQVSLKEKRKLYGTYGSESFLSPGLTLWPRGEELEELKEYEKVVQPHSLNEMLKIQDDAVKSEELRLRSRQDDVAAQMMKMPDMITQYKNKVAKSVEQKQVAMEKRQRLVEKVQDILGYSVSPRDPRFREVLQQAEDEERLQKKQEKKMKKKQKAQERMEKLQEKLAGATQNTAN